MATEILDIVDTAVKIGLGALISGVATYAVTTKNHGHDLAKESRLKKVEILETAIENFDSYFYLFSGCFAAIDGALRAGIEPGEMTDPRVLSEEWSLWKRDGELMESRGQTTKAVARLHLLNLENIVTILGEAQEVETRFRQQVMFERCLPTKEELLGYRKEFGACKKRIYVEFNKVYSNIYS